MIPLQLQHLFQGHFSVYPSINIHLYQEKIIAIVKKCDFNFDPDRGNDLDDWRKRNVDGDSELRPGRSSTWIANQLAEISETLWNRHKTAVHICSILPRLKRVNGFFEIVSEISEIVSEIKT